MEYYQFVGLAFISSVSKQLNTLCKARKQKLGIQNTKVHWGDFQSYFVICNYFNCLKYVHQNCGGLDSETCRFAMEQGSLDCLKYILAHGGYFATDDLILGAEQGHLECIKYVLDKGAAKWHDDILIVAAKKGHLHIIKYFNEKENKWTPDICYSAIYNGQLEILKYAHEAGHECPKDVCQIAVQSGMTLIKSFLCVKYIHDTSPKGHLKDCPFNWEQVRSWLEGQGFTILEKGNDVFVYPEQDED
jgi:hypothetical protein